MSDSQIDSLKNAKDAQDVDAAFTIFGEILNEDFERSAKWLVGKSKKLFDGRLLSGSWAKDFGRKKVLSPSIHDSGDCDDTTRLLIGPQTL